MAWNCIKCGERIEAKFNFCWKCGTAKALPKSLAADRDLSLKDFADYAMPRPKRFIFYSFAVGLVSLIPLAIVVHGIPYTIEQNKLKGFSLSNLSLLAMWYGVFILLWKLSKRFRANPRKALVKDLRGPILYLRPFDIEAKEGGLGDYNVDVRPDETLALALKGVGPLIAVGKPGDKLQPLGAIRLYFDHNSWQENVEALMSFSRLVIIEAGCSSRLNSSGLEWEMSTTIKRLNLNR